jgi:hypothetical protein
MAPADALVQQINVEIEGLRSVADAMRTELDASFRTQVTPIQHALKSGAQIGGHIPGYEFVQLQNLYASHIESTLDALYQLDIGTQAVADAAESIARTYGDADAFAQASLDQVRDVISYAPPPPPPGLYSPSSAPTAGVNPIA